jgi:glycosyltransferase involved in cell wall biosynthesis
VTTVHNSFDRHSFLMRLGDRVVAVSEAERRLLVDRGFAPDRIDVVLNGPNLSPRESFGEGSVSLRRPCITTVCGIHRRKGVSDLLQAFQHVREKSPDWSLNIIGDGPDRSQMESLAETLGLRSSVHFLGYLPSAREALLQTDIFVLASYADPCSLALAEARYAGCALVATSVGGTPELLGFGEHGALFPPGDISALAAALIELTTNSIKLAERRRDAHVGAGHLTNDRLYLDYMQDYERACAYSR